MFEHFTHHFGSIEVICGPMFSGKTEELIRRTRRAEYARMHIQVFKPKIDDRYDESDVISHNQVAYAGKPVSDVDSLRKELDRKAQVIVIDEVQFFSQEIVELCEELANQGKRVIVAGLDLDFRSKPFPVVSELMARAEHVMKLSAICVKCGQPASKSYRLSTQAQQILIGSDNAYEARCRRCFFEGFR